MRIKKDVWSYTFVIIGLFLIFITSCKKEKTIPALETASVNDIDGNVYKTVKIGNQWWMAENLRVTKYRDGNFIRKLQSDTTLWKHDTIGAYCIYDDNITAPGLLYNFYSISNSENIAPIGWHVPSDDEWKLLEEHLGMTITDANNTSWRGTHEGEKLKIQSTQGWTTFGDIWSTNESGFTALAGGCRLFNGIWGDPGLFATGFWWSSTNHFNDVWYRYLDYKNANVFRYYGSKNYGFSIRCVKD